MPALPTCNYLTSKKKRSNATAPKPTTLHTSWSILDAIG
jgi:hypothetical protein